MFSVHIRCKVRFGPIRLPGRHFALDAVYNTVNALAKAFSASYKLIIEEFVDLENQYIATITLYSFSCIVERK